MRTLVALAAIASPALSFQVIDATLISPPVPQVGGWSWAGGPMAASANASDDFNRADGTVMGPDWIESGGDAAILGQAGTANSSGNGWMRHATASGTYADSVGAIDFLPLTGGSTLVYVALIFGSPDDGADSIFVKIQDNNSDGLYDRVFFYKGLNGGSWGAPTYYYDLATPTASGRMQVSFANNGDEAVAEFDVDLDGAIDETYSATGILAAGLGAGSSYGIGFYNQPGYDNWVLGAGGFGPTSYCDVTSANSVSMSGATLVCTGGFGSSTATFDVTGLPNQPGALFCGPGEMNLAFGCHQRCVQGPGVFGTVHHVTGNAVVGSVFDMSLPGLTHVQFWYRDPANMGVCGSAFSLSNALKP